MAAPASMISDSSFDSAHKDEGPSSHTASTKGVREDEYYDYEPYCMPQINESSSDYDNYPYHDEPNQLTANKRTDTQLQKGSDSGTPSSRSKTSKEREQSTALIVRCVLVLLMELAGAMIAVIYYEPLIECCGESFISDSASTAQKWNSAVYGISIGYLMLIIIEIPIVALKQEPVFLFNPMIGFLLAVHMLYVTETTYAYTIYGLETAAMIGQSLILIHMQRNWELCIHALFNYIVCGLVVYLIIEMSRQGGYCIVDGEVEALFKASTCNVGCTDDASCFVCADNSTCFIRFPS